jgi:hypothetical protein
VRRGVGFVGFEIALEPVELLRAEHAYRFEVEDIYQRAKWTPLRSAAANVLEKCRALHLAAFTITVPCMYGCTSQMYRYLPAFTSVWLVSRPSESNALTVDVTVCGS